MEIHTEAVKSNGSGLQPLSDISDISVVSVTSVYHSVAIRVSHAVQEPAR